MYMFECPQYDYLKITNILWRKGQMVQQTKYGKRVNSIIDKPLTMREGQTAQ